MCQDAVPAAETAVKARTNRHFMRLAEPFLLARGPLEG
ncbi:hypothetical protein C8K44_10230 [Aminobacter sp. AP02]|nr:hypothetical protein C8K44_10230 [Aminobacter sp. AP02]